MGIDAREPITKDSVLAKVSQEEIFEKYFGFYPDTNKFYLNPLRTDDKRPGCRFYYDGRGVLKFNDFGRKTNWDCFNVVQLVESCNFAKALEIVATQFNIKRTITFTPLNKRAIEIKVASVEWGVRNLEYWKQYHITQEWLEYFNVKPIKAFWLNEQRYNTAFENAYCYYFYNNKKKIYLPDREYARFYQNTSSLIQGLEQLPETGDVLVITKSYKDVISLRMFGIFAIAPASESVLISPELISELSTRFTSIYSLMDNDRAGKHMAWLLRKEFNIPPLLFPKDMKKDWSDNLKHYGTQFILELKDSISI